MNLGGAGNGESGVNGGVRNANSVIGKFVWRRGLRPFTIYTPRERLIEFSEDYKNDVEVAPIEPH